MLAGVGYIPTVQVGGTAAISGMFAGCAISLLGSLIGGLVLAVARPMDSVQAANVALGSMLCRFVVVGLLATAAGLSRIFEVRALLVWVGISYLGLLAADTWFTVLHSRVEEGSR